MSGAFRPHLEILPPAQQRLWQQLSAAAELGFVLYGGTAIALRLGHRVSVDFDFFPSGRLTVRRFTRVFHSWHIEPSAISLKKMDAQTISATSHETRLHVTISAVLFERYTSHDHA